MDNEPSQMAAINQHKIKCFYLYGANLPGFFKMRSLVQGWDKMHNKIKSERGPFIYRLSAYNRLAKVL